MTGNLRTATAARWLDQSRAALAWLWLIWLLPRAAVLLIRVTPTSDANYYYWQAVNFAKGAGYLAKNGHATAYWPPGWPMAMSVVFGVNGPSVLAVGLLNLACAALSAWLVLDLGRRLFQSELAARLGLLLLAVYPNSIGYVPLALTEVFYTTLLLAVAWLLVARRGALAFVAAGLVLGLATLVKAQTLVVVPLILGIGLLREDNFWRRVPQAALRFAALVALAALVVSPWTLRNHRELGAWVAVSTNGGITLLTGNNDSANGGFTPDDPLVKALDARTGLTEMEYDAEAKRLGVAWIKAHPVQFAQLMPLKLAKLWGPDGEAQWAYETGYADYAEHAGTFRALRIVNQLYYFALLGCFALAAGLIVWRRRKAGLRLIDWWLLPYGVAAYPTAIAMVFSGQSRFHYPAMPFICMTCGWLLADWLVRRGRETVPHAKAG